MSSRRSRYVDRRSEISARLREIDEVMLHAEEQEDLVLRDYLTRLAVIQLSGFIEKSLEHMVNGFSGGEQFSSGAEIWTEAGRAVLKPESDQVGADRWEL